VLRLVKFLRLLFVGVNPAKTDWLGPGKGYPGSDSREEAPCNTGKFAPQMNSL
jgi:hypothetical protein